MQCFPRRAASSIPRPACVSLRRRSFYGRGWITQAALLKTAHWAVFAPSSATGPQLFESTRMRTQSFCKQKTASVSLRWRSFYGRGWIRTTEAEKQQIYSLSPLATREHAHIQFCSPWIACIYYHPDGSLSTSFAEFLDFCAESKNTKAKAAQKSTFLSGFLELVTGVEPATH